MNAGPVAGHEFVPVPPGHTDGPNACATCGYGPGAPWHPARSVLFDALDVIDQAAEAAAETRRRVRTARRVAAEQRDQLAALSTGGGEAARLVHLADVAIARVLAALDGAGQTVTPLAKAHA